MEGQLFTNQSVLKGVTITLSFRLEDLYLDVHLDDGFSNEGRPKKGPKWHQKVTTCDTSQIKQGVRNLKDILLHHLCHFHHLESTQKKY